VSATRGSDEPPENGGEDAVVVPITGELDLHTFAPRDIPAVVADYVTACKELGVRELRLVHGRGKGVQRAVVRRVLLGLAGVADVRDAPPGSGGWGATLTRLIDDEPREKHQNPGKSE
jgi:DNA-nicking Smr family endonuclease